MIVENKDASMENYTVKNTLYSTEPSIIHGNGPSKETLNYLSNYIPNSWNSAEGCISCKRHVLNLQDVADEKLPVVLIGIFIETNTPFLEEFFDKVYNLEYPKNKLHLFIHNSMEYHSNLVAEFVEKHGAEYSSVKQIKPEDGTTEHTARDLSLYVL